MHTSRPPTVPRKRTSNWSSQARDKLDEEYLSDSVNVEYNPPAHQPARRKRAKKAQVATGHEEAAEYENQGQWQDDPRVNGASKENHTSEMGIVSPLSDAHDLKEAERAQKDGLLAAVYDLRSVRKTDTGWLVRSRCVA
ncbi:hypothetical protein GP486_004290 [Trichoglossum hirsutum]|uniref:Uncharacterized protein n=1 Tax=Trichoglossum hirsutum TaxID=265104 RepID=A0A9P8RPD6_9PEZI|nr:hypothetical protein GP486_004290 [Trichoglossum hirsutum]